MDRLPPGQRWVDNLPVLHAGTVPEIDLAAWHLKITGLVENHLKLDWNAFMKLPRVKITRDFHCVTHWSTKDVAWEGVHLKEIIALCKPDPLARFVMIHSYGGYSTNVPLEVLMREDSLFAIAMNDAPLTSDHGAPMRLVVSAKYAWKSAKWVNGIEFMEHDRPGYWESRGYHNDGDPWAEERYE